MTVEDEHGNISVYDTYVPGQLNAHDKETCAACMDERLNAKNDMRRRSASLSDSASESETETEFASQAQAQVRQQSLAIPPMDAEVENIFTSVGLGADENMDDDMDGYSESGNDSDTEEVLHNSCSGIQDVLLTGEVRILLYELTDGDRRCCLILRRLTSRMEKPGIIISSMAASVIGMG